MTEEQESQPSFWFIVLVLLASIAASDIAKQHMQKGAAIGVGACAIGLIAAARSRWDLKARAWFWAALCLGAVMQIPFISLLPWSDRYLTGIGATAFVVPGFLMTLGLVFLAEKFFAGSKTR